MMLPVSKQHNGPATVGFPPAIIQPCFAYKKQQWAEAPLSSPPRAASWSENLICRPGGSTFSTPSDLLPSRSLFLFGDHPNSSRRHHHPYEIPPRNSSPLLNHLTDRDISFFRAEMVNCSSLNLYDRETVRVVFSRIVYYSRKVRGDSIIVRIFLIYMKD